MSLISQKIKEIFQDILKIFKYKKVEKRYKRIFFCENGYIYNYIKNYINCKNSIIISFNKLDLNSDNYFYFNTNFFLEFLFYIVKVKYFYTSTPGIGKNICKKSIFNQTTYIYLQHSAVGLINAYDEDAFKNFDIINSINKFQTEDIKTLNKEFNRKIKIFKSKCSYLKNIYIKTSSNHDVLVAPTWNTDFYEEDFLFELVKKFNEKNLSYIFRPHPMSVKKKEFNLDLVKSRKIKLDLSLNLNLYPYKNLITDWSGIMFEFFYLIEKKPILIETREKKINKSKKFSQNKSFENIIRPKISVIYKKSDINNIIQNILEPQNDNHIHVKEIKNEIFY